MIGENIGENFFGVSRLHPKGVACKTLLKTRSKRWCVYQVPPPRLDEAAVRPGRFDRWVEVPLPDEATRRALAAHFAAGVPDAGAGGAGSDLR